MRSLTESDSEDLASSSNCESEDESGSTKSGGGACDSIIEIDLGMIDT